MANLIVPWRWNRWAIANYPKIFLRLASDDLKALKVLLEKKLYPQTVFHMQQSVEKAAKAFGLLSGDFRFHALKKAGHNPAMVFKWQVDRMSSVLESYAKLEQAYPVLRDSKSYQELSVEEFDTKLKQASGAIANLKSYKLEEVKLDTLDSLIRDIREFEPAKLSKPELRQRLFDEELQSNFRRVLDIIGVIDEKKVAEYKEAFDVVISSKKIKAALLAGIPFFADLFFAGYALTNLSVIFFPHSNDTRYPDAERAFSPYDRYTKHYPTIVRAREIQGILSKTISRLRKVSPHLNSSQKTGVK